MNQNKQCEDLGEHDVASAGLDTANPLGCEAEYPEILHINNQQAPDEPQPSTSKTGSLHVSVKRAQISSTIVQEGEEELEDLDVEVYDQQTYEKGVFEQVNRAISVVDGSKKANGAKNKSSKPSSKIDDLIRVIHDQSDQEHEEDANCDSNDKDEQVLQLTRLERLNRHIKVEKPDHNDCDQSFKALPRIPKISIQIKREPGTENSVSKNVFQISQQPRIIHPIEQKTTRFSHTHDEPQSNREISSGEESTVSEYKPVEDDVSTDDGLDEEIDYSSDSVPGDESDVEKKRSKRKQTKLEDDGDYRSYEARIKIYTRNRAKARLNNILDDGTEFKKLDELTQIDGNLYIPKEMWDNLFEHQKTGVRWLWELHQLGTGGILGDEMGLGKTIQMIAFLTAVRSSNIVNSHKGYENLGPTVLVCPATVMHQWLQEFRKWWQPFRVAILHSTGTFSGDKKDLVRVINKSRGVLIVSYPGVVIYQDYLHSFDWHYAILDEGHKIRNPDAQVTLACKRFRTPHRLILSGSPVQNNLKELWSIFDFIYPGKLGTLPVFMEQFATPITQGGYANASDIQVQIAYKCSCVLRDTIKPFLLRRTKAEVNNKLKLPERSEQVLFCKLTEKQRKLYQAYIESPTVRDIKRGFCQIFVGLIQLRKICNHPDLFDATECHNQIKQLQGVQNKKYTEFFSEDETFGHCKKSGKMMVVEALLKLWKKQNHKVLLFTQSRQMLKIFKSYLDERNYTHLIMDGATPIGIRQTMIEKFNTDGEIFIFLLTTRVGGVGVNLTGANRIIIYDPDWNPSTDIQARERAWRIGQQRHVIIYRLLTAGTIEEKIYHRQVFKLYLTNRVLKNAQQKRFFKTNDLHELFTLGDNDKNIETKALFDDDLQINPESIKKSKERSKAKKRSKEHRKNAEPMFSETELQAMRDRAKRLSQMIARQYGPQDANGTQVRIKTEPGCSQESNEQPELVRIKTEPGLAPAEAQTCTQPTKPEESKEEKRHKKKRLKYLVRQDIYRPDCADVESDSRYKRDDYILERLFKNSNIFGALKHDKIETDSTADYKVVESEAEKVARDAIRALRESRRMCLDSSRGIPNWTGRNGQMVDAPRLVPKNKSRATLMNKPPISSSGSECLLTSIKKRNQSNPVSLARTTFSAVSDSDEEETNRDFEGKAKGTGAEDMADKTRQFILFKSARNGEATTDEILDFFKHNFKPNETAIFKALLYKMCEFQRRGDKGFWLIRSEFRDL